MSGKRRKRRGTGGAGRVRILLVDDHPVVRQGLTQLLAQEGDMIVCGEAETAAEAMKAVEATRPRLAVVDISLKEGTGLDLVKDLRARHPDVAVLVFSMHDESVYAERALRAGARGYVMKIRPPAVLVGALKEVLSGGIHLSPEMSQSLLLRLANNSSAPGRSRIESLSNREVDVLRMLGDGLTTRQIAQKLHRSPKTIDSHRENIKRKLNCRNVAELLREAVRWASLFKLEPPTSGEGTGETPSGPPPVP